ncbi:MAG: hypothetical protein P8X74_06640 [Reinekea sp.]|jgi:putative thiamine transport system permease protein
MAEALRSVVNKKAPAGASNPNMPATLRTIFWPLIPPLTTAVFMVPILFGLLGTWLPAFGYLPAIGQSQFSLQPWQALVHYPGFFSALTNTLVTGLIASILSLMIALFLLHGAYPSQWFNRIERALSPALSIPHAAFAIGFGFLIAPSGWLLRLMNGLTGMFPAPPFWTTFQDPVGISLILVMVLKETPFLLFMALAVLPSLKVSQTLWLVRSQGHGKAFAWRYLIFPRLYQQIRLPFFAVVAYSLTVVDIAIIAGPTTPPTLAVLILQRFNDPDLVQRTVGAAGATLLLGIVMIVLIGLSLLQQAIQRWDYYRLCHIKRPKRHWSITDISARVVSVFIGTAYIGTLTITLLWSITKRWRYPDILPESFGLRAWVRLNDRLAEPFWCTFLLAILSSLLALILVILALENELRLSRLSKRVSLSRIQWLVYLPLLIPQIAFIFGFQIALIHFGLDAQFITLLWSHLVFVFPYVFLTLSGPYRRFDERYSWQGLTLIGQRWKVFWRIKLPMLLRPILYTLATGFAVSIAQYLPTLFVGAGKYSTITTEAVAIATGSDRRMMAVIALWQQTLPLLAFASATIIPILLFRHRKAMSHQ